MNAIVIQVTETMETNIALVYKSVFLGETATILKNMGLNVRVIDATIEGYTLNEVAGFFCESPDLVIFVADVQQSRITMRTAQYCRLCAPECKLLVMGRATSFIPQYFLRPPFDAVHISGDREAAIMSYVRMLKGEIKQEECSNLAFPASQIGFLKTEWLNPEHWSLPDLSCLNLEAYHRLNDKQHPERDLILGVTSTKGCSFGCKYCGASTEEGRLVRYGIPERIVKWGNACPNGCVVHLYSPNFMISSKWLKQYTNAYEEANSTYSWRGVTRISSISEEKMSIIFQHNCQEIAVGLEMMRKHTDDSLKGTSQQFHSAIRLCEKYGVKLKCLLMLGYPGYSLEDVTYTIRFLRERNLSYRITGYTPLQDLIPMSAEELDKLMIEKYDRRMFYFDSGIDSKLYYQILSSNGAILT